MKTETRYEYNRIADRKRVDFISDVLDKSSGTNVRVLDVGCGNGVISRHLGALGYNVLGIDVSDKTIEMARSLTTMPNVRFERKSAEELVASGEKYDVVICSEVLEHLSDPGALLSVLYDTIKDDGRLIVTVPNGNGPRELFVTRPILHIREKQTWLWKFINKIKSGLGYKGTTVQSAADNLDHIQFFSISDLEGLAQKNNFRIVRFGKSNFVEDVFPFSFFTKRLPVLQKMDCKVAEILPLSFTGGFFSVWEKQPAK